VRRSAVISRSRILPVKLKHGAALERELKGKPSWLEVEVELVIHPQYEGWGRPRKDTSPATHQWQIVASLTVNKQQLDEEAEHSTCWIIGTNVLDTTMLSEQDLLTIYYERGGVEYGFRFLRDPLFLDSSVTVSKPERIMALNFIMLLCLLSHHLAEFRLRTCSLRHPRPFPI
jgi:transposase